MECRDVEGWLVVSEESTLVTVRVELPCLLHAIHNPKPMNNKVDMTAMSLIFRKPMNSEATVSKNARGQAEFTQSGHPPACNLQGTELP